MSKKSKIFLGIDCGATHLRVGLVTAEGQLLSSKITASPLKHEPEKLAEQVKIIVGNANFEAIGLGVPGPLDIKRGLILSSANLGNIVPINLYSQFERVFDSKVYLDRDTNVALLGESWQGAAQHYQEVIMLTIGSGVGGAILANGEIERGESDRAGELGHMYLEISNSKFQTGNLPRCGLGHEGCLEALINSANNLDEIGTYLGYGLANIVDIFNPQKIIIGGGKIKMGDFLTKAVEVMKEVGMKPAIDEVSIEYAKLKEMAGVIGAAKLAYDSYQNP